MPSSFSKAFFQPVLDYDAQGLGKQRKREGRALWSIHGEFGDGLSFHIGYEGSGLTIHVPEGFVTDGPSIPGIVRWAIPNGAIARAMKAAAVHDRLCEHPLFTRPEADAQFLVAMYAEGTPAVWREIFFAAVRTNSSKKVADENRQLDLFDGRRPGA